MDATTVPAGGGAGGVTSTVVNCERNGDARACPAVSRMAALTDSAYCVCDRSSAPGRNVKAAFPGASAIVPGTGDPPVLSRTASAVTLAGSSGSENGTVMLLPSGTAAAPFAGLTPTITGGETPSGAGRSVTAKLPAIWAVTIPLSPFAGLVTRRLRLPSGASSV